MRVRKPVKKFEETKPEKVEDPMQSGLDAGAIDDPFALLKRKTAANEIVQQEIEKFLLNDQDHQSMARQRMLTEQQAERLAKTALSKLAARGVKRVEFSQFDFDTALQMYGKGGRLPVKQLEKFLKNMAEL